MKTHKHCPACNASVPVQEKRCPFCDAKQLTRAEVAIYQFFSDILPGRYPATGFLLLLNVAIFVLMSIDILSQPDPSLSRVLWSPPGDVLIRWGAHFRGEFEPWRFITANFVHIGLLHILFNMSALRYIGPQVERQYGGALTIATYVFLGFGSMLCSNVLGKIGLVAGASGALMAFIGMAAAAGHRAKTAYGKEVRNTMLKWGAFILGFGLLVSFSGSMGIDNIAHLAGLILGGGVGLILPQKSVTGFTKPWKIRLSAVLCVLSFVCIARGGYGLVEQKKGFDAFQECVEGLKATLPAASTATACKTAVEKNPKEFGAYHNLALYYWRTQKPREAVDTCKKTAENFTSQDIIQKSELCSELLGLKARKDHIKSQN